MKQRVLVEGQFGHGGMHRNRFWHFLKKKWRRLTRKKVGKARIPFDWATGVVNKPIYNIKNQYQSDSCWGQSYSRAIQIVLACEELSAKSAYSPIFSAGGGVGLSDGTNLALNIGLTTEAKIPSTENGVATEAFMEDNSWRTPDMKKDALTRAGYEIVNVNIDIDSVAEAIRDYGFVIIELIGQNNGTWLSSKPIPPDTANNKNPVWIHYMCSNSNVYPYSLTNNEKQISLYQSWGSGVGNNGFQTFTQAYISPKYILDIFTFKKFTFDSDLCFGMYGDSVKQLQRVLGVPMTGWFGSLTLKAVQDFQTKNGISPTFGYVGIKTRPLLNKLV